MSLWSRIERRVGELAGELLPDEDRERVDQARAHLDSADPQRASELLETVVAQRPTNSAALSLLGAARLALRDAEAALAAFEGALAIHDDLADAHVGRGEALLALSRPAQAVTAFRRAVRHAGGDEQILAEAYRGQGLAHRATGDGSKAIRELRKAVTEAPDDARALAALGDCLLTAPGAGAAHAHTFLVRATELPDAPAEAWLHLGRAELALGKVAAAGEAFTRASTHPDVGTARADALAGLGDVYRARGDRAAAHAQYLQALGVAARSAGLHARIADLQASSGDYAAALASYERAIDLGADLSVARRALDAALAGDLAGSDKGVFFANQVLASEPTNSRALTARAVSLDDDAARATLHGALEQGEDLEARIALGRIALRSKQLQEAIDQAWAALRVDPRSQRARQLLRETTSPPQRPTDSDDGELYVLAKDLQQVVLSEPCLADLAAETTQAVADFDQPLLVTVMGEFSSGKSTFINALVTEEIAPVGITPTTATINVVKLGRDKGGRVLYRDGRVATLPWPALSATLQQLDGDAAREISQVEILYPAPELEKVSIVDTPGLNSILPEHEQVAREFIARADAVVWVFSAGQAGKSSERAALAAIRAEGKRVLGVLNKIDQLSEQDVQELCTHLTAELGDLVDIIVPLSARRALAHRCQGADNDGNWPALAEALEQRFFSRARELKRLACHRRLGALISRARARIQDRRAAAASAAATLGEACDDARADARRFVQEVVPAVRRALTEEVAHLYRGAAREVLELVRPRSLPFGSHQASVSDRDYLLGLLDAGYSALLAPQRTRVATELTAAGLRAAAAVAREVGVVGAAPAAAIAREVEESIRLVEAEVFARADAFVRGYLRGGVVDRFFRQDLPKLQLSEDAAYHALYRDSPDLDTEIATPLGSAGEAALTGLAARLSYLAGLADAEAFALEVGVGGALTALDARRRNLAD